MLKYRIPQIVTLTPGFAWGAIYVKWGYNGNKE